jgi:hypothetical protein
MARVQVITRQGCHLCDEALAVVRSVCAGTGTGTEAVEIEVTDIDIAASAAGTAGTDSADLLAQFGWDVPVVRVDGRVLAVHRVDAGRLQAALAAAPGTWRPW